MKPYLLIIRSESFEEAGWSPEQIDAHMGRWGGYMETLVTAGAEPEGEPLADEGQVVKANEVLDGPFAEGKEVVGGYMIIKAADATKAAELAQGCPVLELPGGTVEVREITPMEM